jgi:RimJ/RimL family protein N-acetyltransferase
VAVTRPTVTLRPVADDDLAAFHEHQLDREAAAMAVFVPRDRASFDAHWAQIRADETMVASTILADGDVAGNVVSWVADGRRLVGYWIGRPFWGRGIATAGLAAFLDALPERPLWAYVAVANAGSIRVLEKCGFARVDGRTHAGVEEHVYRLGDVSRA